MLDTLTDGFRNARLKVQGKARLSEANISEALKDVRVSLLEADVDLNVVKGFLSRVKERSLGEVVALKNKEAGEVSAGDHFVKICHDELVDLMGGVAPKLDLTGEPAVIMMVGLQGAGKTTTAGKLAKMLADKGHKPMLVAADIYRPAAIDQLTTLGGKLGLPVFSIKGMKPVELSKLAVAQAKSVGRDVVIIDTAGRLAIDNDLMNELIDIKRKVRPDNILFVCDSMIGQDAVRTAAAFDKVLDFSAFVLTKFDGDARGGAALSIREVTGKSVAFVGMGEGLDALEEFRPEGVASRILGMGDVVGLVQDFQQHVDEEQAAKDAEKLMSGDFTFNDFLKQLETIQSMGSLTSIMDKLPGFSDMKSQIPEGALDDSELEKVKVCISSMTKQERANPDLLVSQSRIQRIARGCGQQPKQVADMYKRFLGARQMMRQMGQATGMFGSLNKMRKMRKRMKASGMDMSAMAGMMPPPEPKETIDPIERAERRKAARANRKKRGRKGR